MKKTLFLFFAGAISLSACSHFGGNVGNDEGGGVAAAPGNEVKDILGRSAEEIAGSLRDLSETRQAMEYGHRVTPYPAHDRATGSMTAPVTIGRWTGPIRGLVEIVCQRTGYRLEVHGRPPAAGVIVEVEGNHRPAVDILKDAGLQAGDRADILVRPLRKTVELRYAADR